MYLLLWGYRYLYLKWLATAERLPITWWNLLSIHFKGKYITDLSTFVTDKRHHYYLISSLFPTFKGLLGSGMEFLKIWNAVLSQFLVFERVNWKSNKSNYLGFLNLEERVLIYRSGSWIPFYLAWIFWEFDWFQLPTQLIFQSRVEVEHDGRRIMRHATD